MNICKMILFFCLLSTALIQTQTQVCTAFCRPESIEHLKIQSTFEKVSEHFNPLSVPVTDPKALRAFGMIFDRLLWNHLQRTSA
ncbi:MAG: hypothetical protein JNL11_13800 [Bdellovibrionaceae bacterium]|nr:hypothetical protein [Pseudobdellovibrionaceae bacterium]